MAARRILALRPNPARIPAILLATTVLTSAGSAAAQEAGTPPAPQAAPGALQEIVVTANRRSESKENVPIAIEAFSADQLAATGVTNVVDLGTITPGLVMGDQDGYIQPRLRGVGTLAESPGVENPIALYVDGVYYATMPGSMLDLANIESVEIDKGPQGTLFGRNATGGLIQITTLDPKPDFQGWASVGYGDYNTVGTDVYVTDGISDTLSANFAAHFSDQGEGYGRNAFNGQYVNKTQELSLRNKWLFRPSGDTQFKLVLDYEQSNSSPVLLPAPGTLPIGAPPYTGPTQGVDGYFQPYNIVHQGGVSLQIDHDFDFAHFVSTTAYRQFSMDDSFDGDLTPLYALALNIETFENHRQLTQEFQLQSPAESALKWVTGVYLYNADANWNPLLTAGGLLTPFNFIDTYSDQKSYSGAIYGQGTYEVLPDTNLTLGLRYTIERRDFHAAEILVLPGNFIIPAGQADAHTIFQKPTWRISLDHHFTPDLMAYVSYNRGFKSGGFNDDLIPAAAFAPETLDAYEIGGKADFLDHHLRLDLAGFYYDYKNLQEVRYPNGVEDIFNAPEAEIYGLDIDAKAALIPNLTATLGLEILHDQYTTFPNAPVSIPAGPPFGGTIYTTGDVAGHRLAQTPDWTVDFSLDYVVPTSVGDFIANFTYSYVDGWYAEADNRLRQGPYSVVNTQIAWHSSDDLYTVTVWGRNMLDTQYLVALDSQANGDFAQYAPPRTFGVTLKRSF